MNYPEKCEECLKLNNQAAYFDCDFCKKVGFKEKILCDLNRMGQDYSNFQCHSFQPKTRIKKSENIVNSKTPPNDNSPLCSIDEVLRTYKFKSERQEAMKKLDINSDECVYVDLRFHYVFNVLFLKSIFTPKKDFYNIYNIFLKSSKLVGGFSFLLWISSDHVHAYVETDGQQSVEEIFQKLKTSSTTSIIADHSRKSKSFQVDQVIWSDEYFVETISAGNLGFLEKH